MNNELEHHGIFGMRWGVRRYQNADGTLTDAGKKRYSKDVQANKQKPKDKRVDEDSLNDPDRWVREDLNNAKTVTDSGKEIVNTASELERKTAKKNTKPLDLSSMTDQDLRNAINRNLLEKQYNEAFNKQEISKGREYVRDVLDYGGAALGVASSAIGIALAIKQLRG